jgi:hypothetical protein
MRYGQLVDLRGDYKGKGGRLKPLTQLPTERWAKALSTIGDVFVDEDIDEGGYPRFRTSWIGQEDGASCLS